MSSPVLLFTYTPGYYYKYRVVRGPSSCGPLVLTVLVRAFRRDIWGGARGAVAPPLTKNGGCMHPPNLENCDMLVVSYLLHFNFIADEINFIA